MKKTGILLLVLVGLFIGNSLAASPFSENVFEPLTDGISDAAAAAKENYENLKKKTVKTFADISGKIENLRREKLDLNDLITHKIFIPGHENKNFICQGITYLPEKVFSDPARQLDNRTYKTALLSYYPNTDKVDLPAQIVAIDLFADKPLARFSLFLDADKPYRGHAGGITVAGKYLWVASGFKLYAFSLQSVIDFVADTRKSPKPAESFSPQSLQLPAKKLVAEATYAVDSKASFVSFDGQRLWVGDFSKSGKSYAPIAHHCNNPWKKSTWISGYQIDSSGFPTSRGQFTFMDGETKRKVNKPDLVICCREMVQGMAIFAGHAALSISYGAANSKLALYSLPANLKGTRIKVADGYEVEAIALGEKEGNWLKTIKLPAGSEDIEFDGRFLYVTFEGSSKKYRLRWELLNPRLTISEHFYLLNPGRLLKK